MPGGTLSLTTESIQTGAWDSQAERVTGQSSPTVDLTWVMPAEGDSVVRFAPASLLAGVLFWGTLVNLRPEELAQRLRLYVITDAQAARGRDLVRLIASALDGGATAVQLRAKSGSTLAQVELGRELRRLTREAGALFLVNDRVDVAYAVEADGVHLGQDDLPAAVARAILGPLAIVGGSAGNLAELAKALAAGVDYLGVGPMYPSPSKADAGAAIGPAGLAEIRRSTYLPIVGIGGIDAANLGPVMAAGADGVAVISAIIGAERPGVAARRVRAAVDAELARRS
jgi:thiamine-phosphate pyrophosphorylase